MGASELDVRGCKNAFAMTAQHRFLCCFGRAADPSSKVPDQGGGFTDVATTRAVMVKEAEKPSVAGPSSQHHLLQQQHSKTSSASACGGGNSDVMENMAQGGVSAYSSEQRDRPLPSPSLLSVSSLPPPCCSPDELISDIR